MLSLQLSSIGDKLDLTHCGVAHSLPHHSPMGPSLVGAEGLQYPANGGH